MKHYSENASCPKCNCRHVSTVYEHLVCGGDGLRRVCGRCGYTWLEACEDTGTEEGGKDA